MLRRFRLCLSNCHALYQRFVNVFYNVLLSTMSNPNAEVQLLGAFFPAKHKSAVNSGSGLRGIWPDQLKNSTNNVTPSKTAMDSTIAPVGQALAIRPSGPCDA